MQALQFTDNIPRYVVGKAAGRVYPSALWRGVSCLRSVEVEPPALPAPDWVRIRTRYGGICGSDVSMARLNGSTAASPFISFPCTLGHENVGVIAELGSGVAASGPLDVGQRVVVNPLLPCATRALDPCPMCACGEFQLCQRFRDGALPPGMLTGYCSATGGSWSPEFVAHQSQLVSIPAEVSDENAVLIEPFAVALHAVLRNPVPEGSDILIIGAGSIGLLVLAALRATGTKARIIVTARHPVQRAMAERLGADIVLKPDRGHRFYEQVVGITGGEVLRPVIGKRVVRGGAATVFECVGSSQTIDDALRLTASGGNMVLVGVTGVPKGVDWTPVWLNEVRITGAYCYAMEQLQGERIHAFDLAVRFLANGLDLSPLVTHRFPLAGHRRAFDAVTSKSSSGVIKAVFEFDPAV